MPLDSLDRELLNLIQTEFPFSKEPYHDMGQRVGNSADELIQRIKRLKKEGIIRLIGPVLNPRRLGLPNHFSGNEGSRSSIGEDGGSYCQPPWG